MTDENIIFKFKRIKRILLSLPIQVFYLLGFSCQKDAMVLTEPIAAVVPRLHLSYQLKVCESPSAVRKLQEEVVLLVSGHVFLHGILIDFHCDRKLYFLL